MCRRRGRESGPFPQGDASAGGLGPSRVGAVVSAPMRLGTTIALALLLAAILLASLIQFART
jgi:hypothetical protein